MNMKSLFVHENGLLNKSLSLNVHIFWYVQSLFVHENHVLYKKYVCAWQTLLYKLSVVTAHLNLNSSWDWQSNGMAH